MKHCLLSSFKNVVVKTIDTNITSPFFSSQFPITYRSWLQLWRRQKVLQDYLHSFTIICINDFLHYYWLWYHILVFWHIKEYLVKCIVPELKQHWNFHKIKMDPRKSEGKGFQSDVLHVLLMIHIIAYVRTMLTACGSFCLQNGVIADIESFPREERYLHISYLAYTAAWRIWVLTLQPSDQIPSPVEWDGSTPSPRYLWYISAKHLMLI